MNPHLGSDKRICHFEKWQIRLSDPKESNPIIQRTNVVSHPPGGQREGRETVSGGGPSIPGSEQAVHCHDSNGINPQRY